LTSFIKSRSSDAGISVVIPLYNKAPHIQRAIDSVFAQTYNNYEIIVVDDGSTDESADVIKNILDSRIHLITQENAGVSAARNRGIHEAKYGIVAFLDADDEWLPEFLELVVHEFEKDPAVSVAFTNYRLSNSLQAVLIPHQVGRLVDYFEFCLVNNGRGMFSSCVLVKRDILLKIGGFPLEMHHGEDIYTWTQLAWLVPIAFVPQVLAIYHIGAVNQATGNPRLAATGFIATALMCRDRLRQGLVPFSLVCSTRAYTQFVYLLAAKELREAGDTFLSILNIIKSGFPLLRRSNVQLYFILIFRILIPLWMLRIYRQIKLFDLLLLYTFFSNYF